jgi:hypothetical protein
VSSAGETKIINKEESVMSKTTKIESCTVSRETPINEVIRAKKLCFKGINSIMKTAGIKIDLIPFTLASEADKWMPLWNNRRSVMLFHQTTLLNQPNIGEVDRWRISRIKHGELSILWFDAYRTIEGDLFPNKDTSVMFLLMKGKKFIGIGKCPNKFNESDKITDSIIYGSYGDIIITMKRALNVLLTQPGRFSDPKISKEFYNNV